MQICDQVGGKKEPKTRLGEKAQGVCVAIQEVRFDPSSIVLALERADFFIGLASLEAPLKNVFPRVFVAPESAADSLDDVLDNGFFVDHNNSRTALSRRVPEDHNPLTKRVPPLAPCATLISDHVPIGIGSVPKGIIA